MSFASLHRAMFGERSMNFDLKCACEAYKMLFSAEIEQDGSAISGNWFENEYRQGGKIYGRAR
jgi:hypothetical protein